MAAKKKGSKKEEAPAADAAASESAESFDGPPISGDEPSTRERKKPKQQDESFELEITSLLDILTILLVFFLKSYSNDPVKVTPGGDLELPPSSAQISASDAVPVTITKRGLLVNDRPVVEIRDGKVDAGSKRDGATGFFITPLFDALAEEAEKQKYIAKRNPSQQFTGLANLIADKDTPYRLLQEVMYTAGQAEFGRFKFAVVKAKE